MSITDELKKYANRYKNSHDAWSGIGDELAAIADRIDIAHKHAIGYVDDRDPETMAENGWIRLPKDADGEYIRIGDELTDDAEFKSEGVVECLMLDESGWFVGFGKGWTDTKIHEWHHYHATSVEDVMVEFATDWESAQDGEDKTAVLKEYASKLRLAEGEDA